MKKICVFLLFIIFIGNISWGQHKYQNISWKKDKHKIFINLGTSNFLGDLGGANRIGSGPFNLRDFDYQAIRPSIQLGYLYHFSNHFSSRSFFNYAWLSGNDANTTEPFRNNRNLNFRTPVYELGSAIEFSYEIYQKGHNYRLKGVRGIGSWNTYTYTPYTYIGVGGFYFNSKGKYNGVWHALLPLSTEGQGLISTRKKYSSLQFTIPLGVGFKVKIAKAWEIGIEYKANICFTDYIDDVSTTYFDKNALLQEKGQLAVDMANPSNPNSELYYATFSGEQRGNPKRNDSYMALMITLYYSLKEGFIPKHRF
ncbi:MAG: DUF6089 family protein [Bacteroidota bacterium]